MCLMKAAVFTIPMARLRREQRPCPSRHCLKRNTEQLCDLDEHGDEGSKGCSHYKIRQMRQEVPLEEHLWSAA